MSKKEGRVVTKTRNKKPIIRSHRDYDFLKNIRLVYRWALTNNDLSRGELELLLFLYPEGAFSKRRFGEVHKIISIYQQKTFDKYLEEGWIVLWRAQKGRVNALYTLSSKAKNLCSRMHKILLGEIEISENPKYNILAKGSEATGVKMDDYFFNAIKEMNTNIRKQKSDKE